MNEYHKRVDLKLRKTFVAAKVPAKFDGLKAGDKLGMVLSGTGNDFAYALSRTSEILGGNTFVGHIHSKKLKDRRGEKKDDDAQVLAELMRDEPSLFNAIELADRQTLRIKHALRMHGFAQEARMKCAQRTRQIFIGTVFYDEKAAYPEGSLAKALAFELANNRQIIALQEVEDRCKKELMKAVKGHPAWKHVLKEVKGVGASIAGALLGSIGHITRFETAENLVAYVGLNRPGGQFRRKRSGEVANWQATARQALYSFDDQINRHKGASVWSAQRERNKAEYRRIHPHPIKVVGGSSASEGLKHLLRGVLGVLQMGDYVLEDEGLEITSAAQISEILETGIASNPEAFAPEHIAAIVADYRTVIADIIANGKHRRVVRRAKDPSQKEKTQLWDERGALITLYSNGHIQKMARWRTVSEFTRWLWEALTELDKELNQDPEQLARAA